MVGWNWEMNREPRRLWEVLDQGQFAVTIEYNPPKGTNIAGVLDNAKQLVGRVHGVNVTDNTAAVVRAGLCPSATSVRTRPGSVEHMTWRDRNRIGIQSVSYGASMLGIATFCAHWDYPNVGDHKSQAWYDLDASSDAARARAQHGGIWPAISGGSTAFTIGAAGRRRPIRWDRCLRSLK